MKRIVCLLAIFLPAAAQACLFARDAQPKDWLEWANVLVAADVSGVEQDRQMDVVRLRIVETFKGPPMAQTATLQIPSRMWASCKLERPAIGQRVLTAINANGDALLVPLTAEFADRLRSAPAPTSR